MNAKKALIRQLSVFQTLSINKALLRRELRKNGQIDITMYDGAVLPCRNMSEVWKCVKFNYKKITGKSYRS